MCFRPISSNISEVILNLRWAIFSILIICLNCSCVCFDTAMSSADLGQDNFHAFNVLLDLLQIDQLLYEEYRKAHEDPASSIVFSIVIQSTPFVLPALQIAEEGGIMRMRPGMQLFPSVDLSGYHGGGNEKVVIAKKVAGLTKERIREVSAKLVEPYTTEIFPEEGFHRVVSLLFKRMRMPISSWVSRPATMNFRTYFGLRGIHEIAERFQPPYANPPISYTEPLDPKNYALSYTGSLLPYNVPSLVSEAFESLSHSPFPSRSIKAHVLEEGKYVFQITDEHTGAADTAAPVAAAPIAAAPIAVAPTAAAPITAAVAVPVIPANAAIAEEAAQAPVTAGPVTSGPGNAVMNDIAMDDGATDRPPSTISEGHSDDGGGYEDDGMNYGAEDYEQHQLDDGFGPNPGENPGDLPNSGTRGTISARPNEVNSEADAVANPEEITSDDSIFEDSYLAVNRGRKRGANEALLGLRESSMPNSKRQASAEKIAEIEAMLEDIHDKQDEIIAKQGEIIAKQDKMMAEYQATNTKRDAEHQAVLEAMNVQADATNQAMLEAAKRDAANQIRLKAANQTIKATANALGASGQANSAAINLLRRDELRRDKLRRDEIRRAALEKSKAEKCRARKTKNFRARMAGARMAGTRKARARNARAKKAKEADAKEAEAGHEHDAHSGTDDQSPPIQNSLVTRMSSSMKFWNLSWRRAPQQNIADEPGYEGAMGAIPQLAVREPKTDTAEAEAEAKEEEPTPVEENPNDGNLLMIYAALVLGVVLIGAVFICLIVSVIDTPTSESSVDPPAIEYPPSFSIPTAKISDIDCEAGLEVAAAFCSESECIREVEELCEFKITYAEFWQNESVDAQFKAMEDLVSKRLM